MPVKEIHVVVCLDCDGRLYLDRNVAWHGKCPKCGGISGFILENIVQEEDVLVKEYTCRMCGDSFNKDEVEYYNGVAICPNCSGGSV